MKEAISIFYSLIETAKANMIEPFSYLSYLFEQLPYCFDREDYEKLLPFNVDQKKLKPYFIPE